MVCSRLNFSGAQISNYLSNLLLAAFINKELFLTAHPNFSSEQQKTFSHLRFFAFLKVFLLHLPLTAFPFFAYLKNGGGIEVIFFFVLSGFLITYILLVEKKHTDTIDLKRFFFEGCCGYGPCISEWFCLLF